MLQSATPITSSPLPLHPPNQNFGWAHAAAPHDCCVHRELYATSSQVARVICLQYFILHLCLTLPLMEWRKPMSIGLSRGERVSMICLAILTQYQSVSDKQTSFDSTVHAMHCTALCVMCCNNNDKKNVKVNSNKLWCKWQIHYLTCEDPWAILTDTSHQDSCVQNLSYQHHLHYHQPASFAVIHNQK